MRIFISNGKEDRALAVRIGERLTEDGHQISGREFEKARGDEPVLEHGIDEIQKADVSIVLVSEAALSSQWVKAEFSKIALQYRDRQKLRIIAVRVDQTTPPSYLSARLVFDFWKTPGPALEELSRELKRSPKALPEAPSPIESRQPHLEQVAVALAKGNLTLVCGAGINGEAGIPMWHPLLLELLEAMLEQISRDRDMRLPEKAAELFNERTEVSALILAKYIKNTLGAKLPAAVRSALYAKETSEAALVRKIVDLAQLRRDSMRLDSIITFNFDDLIERGLRDKKIPNNPVYSGGMRTDPNKLPIYHVHGFLPEKGHLPAHKSMDLVLSEDAYHKQFLEPFSWANQIQFQKFTQTTCLFLGLSVTDPNLRRMLDLAKPLHPDSKLPHYLVKKLPDPTPSPALDEVCRLVEEQDANALGMNMIWVEKHEHIPGLLQEVMDLAQNEDRIPV